MSHLEILKTEKEIHNLTFWNSEKAIERYCQSILRYCNQSNKIVNVRLVKDAQPRCDFGGTRDNITRYEIILPLVEHSLHMSRQEAFRITTKMFVFLRHELAHVLYSFDNIEELYRTHRPTAEVKSLINAFEDSRIEALFGNAFHGTNDYFFHVRKFFWKTEKKSIETGKPNLSNYGLYFIYRFKKLGFENTPTIQLYNKIYNETIANFLNCNSNGALFGLADFIKKAYFPDKKQEQKEEEEQQQTPSPSSSENTEEEINQEQTEQTESQGQGETAPESNDEVNAEELDSQAAEGEAEETYDFESSEDEIEKEIEDAFGEPEYASNVEREIFDGVDNSEGKSSIEELAEMRENQYKGLRAQINEALLKEIVKNTVSSDNKKLALFEAYLPEIVRYCDVVEKKNAYKHYEEIVRENKKTIAEAVNYLKLKFQSRIKKSIRDNRSDGIIDNRNVYKVLIKNDGDYKIFFNTLKDIQTNAEAVLLFDFSGSMSSNLPSVFRCMVIFSEVLNTLAIKHSIYGYAGSRGFTLVSKNNIPKVFTEKRLDVAKRVFGTEYSAFVSGDIGITSYTHSRRGKSFDIVFSGPSNQGSMVCFRDARTNHNDWKMTLGCAALDNRFTRTFSGSTPEFQAVISLRDKYKHLNIKNKLMFLFNDGGYDKIKMDSFLPKEINQFNSDADLLCDYVSTIAKLNVVNDFGYYKHVPYMTNAVCDALDHLVKTLHETEDPEVLAKCAPHIAYLKDIKADVRNNYTDGKYIIKANNELYMTSAARDASINVMNRLYYKIGSILKEYFASYVEGDTVYSAVINDMRDNGWIFSGFGINCNGGVNYIGEKNFQVISSRQITEKMVEKIKAVL